MSCHIVKIRAGNADAGLRKLTTRRNANAGLTFFDIPVFRHFHIFFSVV
jgi:hypothetical protein